MHTPERSNTIDYYLECIVPNQCDFDSYQEKLSFLVDNHYVHKGLVDQYHPVEIEQLYRRAKAFGKSYESLDHLKDFYNHYALVDRHTGHYLEDIEDRYVWTALHLGGGDSIEALHALDRMLTGKMIPPLDVFKYAGKLPHHNQLDVHSPHLEKALFSKGK